MNSDLLYTPVQDRTATWNKHGRSTTYSGFNKSYTNYKSTEVGSHSPHYTSSAVSRLEEARRTIDSVIVDL